MDNKKQENINSAIQHFITGNASSDEQMLLLDWINKNPENSKILFAEKDIWDSSQLGTENLNKIEVEQWIALQERIGKQNQKTIQFKEILRIAALFIIALGAGWLGHYWFSEVSDAKQMVEMKSIEAAKGQLKEIFLADGTHVWLNSDSKLTFPSGFKSNSREIELQGEAYFEVTSDEKNPFLVKTKNHTVKVTGTKFNICEYPESKIIETTLIEGKVKIITGNIINDLKPGQTSTFYTESAKVKISEPDFEIYTSWKDGRYEFNNEPISKIFQIVERWWDVKIDYPVQKLENERISGVLRKHKPLEQHFQVIQQLIPIDFQINNDEIKIHLK